MSHSKGSHNIAVLFIAIRNENENSITGINIIKNKTAPTIFPNHVFSVACVIINFGISYTLLKSGNSIG
jgi:hypothetical protein